MVASPAPTTPAAPCFLGADISKEWVDFADLQGRTAHIDNTVTALTAALSEPCPSRAGAAAPTSCARPPAATSAR